MKVSDLLPNFVTEWMTPEAKAEAEFVAQETVEALNEKRRLLSIVDEQQRALMQATVFIEAARKDYEKVKDALVFAKTSEETLLLQGRARALHAIATAPESIEEQRRGLEKDIAALETQMTDAG